MIRIKDINTDKYFYLNVDEIITVTPNHCEAATTSVIEYDLCDELVSATVYGCAEEIYRLIHAARMKRLGKDGP